MTRPTDDNDLEAMAVKFSHAAEASYFLSDGYYRRTAAMLRACKGRVRVKPGEIERSVWSAMKWATENNPGFDGVPEYTDRGNSFAETECRAAAARILAALEPAPDHAEWNAAIEAAMDACTKVIKSYDVMDETGTKYLPMKTQKAAKGMVSIAREDIGKLKKGQTND